MNLYANLGIEPTDDLDEIKRAYELQSINNNTSSSTFEFKIIKDASYAVLSDPVKKSNYDRGQGFDKVLKAKKRKAETEGCPEPKTPKVEVKAEPEELPEAKMTKIKVKAEPKVEVKAEPEELPESEPFQDPEASTSTAGTVKIEVSADVSRPEAEYPDPTGIVGDAYLYVGEEAFNPDSHIPSETYTNTELFSEIRVYKNNMDWEREKQLKCFHGQVKFAVQEEFKDLVKMSRKSDREHWGKWSRRVDAEELQDLCQRYHFTSGKWLLMVSWREVDEVWNNLKKALVEGKLPEEVLYIRVFCRDDNDDDYRYGRHRKNRYWEEHDSNAVISIATNNWTDKAATMAIAKSIRETGVHESLRYKPEIFTALGIYYKNSYSLKTTVYEV